MTDDFAFRVGCVSHVGLVREHNEDSVLAQPAVGIWAVSDGMGGYGNGDLASQTVVEALKTLAPNDLGGATPRGVRAEDHWRQRGPPDIGAFAQSADDRRHFGRVDRTRRPLRLRLVRRQQSLSPSQQHPDPNLARPFGGSGSRRSGRHQQGRGPSVAGAQRHHARARRVGPGRVEIVDGPVQAGDRFLLCSDGLIAHVTDDEIAAQLATDDPQAACDELLKLTLGRGASDNVSIIVVDCYRRGRLAARRLMTAVSSRRFRICPDVHPTGNAGKSRATSRTRFGRPKGRQADLRIDGDWGDGPGRRDFAREASARLRNIRVLLVALRGCESHARWREQQPSPSPPCPHSQRASSAPSPPSIRRRGMLAPIRQAFRIRGGRRALQSFRHLRLSSRARSVRLDRRPVRLGPGARDHRGWRRSNCRRGAVLSQEP